MDNDGLVDFIVGNGAGTQSKTYRTSSVNTLNVFLEAAIPFGLADDDTFDLAVLPLSSTQVDIILGNNGQTNKVYLGTGTTTDFSAITGTNIGIDTDSTRSIKVGQMNPTTDGLLDIVAGNARQTDKVYLNPGSDDFTSVTAIEISPDAKDTRGLTLKDVDGDLVMDVTITTAAGLTETYINDINGATPDNFLPAQAIGGGGTPSRAIAVGDLDSNGFKDIISGNQMYLNTGSGDFSAVEPYTLGGNFEPRSIAIADIDNDVMHASNRMPKQLPLLSLKICCIMCRVTWMLLWA